jgi:DNA-binding helix-hairpin-helix protein with protein kinase domain
MTTRRSSSRRESLLRSAALTDAHGRPIRLGSEIGKGGEGSVFAVEGEPSLVAKIYYRLPLSSGNAAKLEALVACRSSELDGISAWPRSVVFDSRRNQPCGILMPHITQSRHLHELYGTYNRRHHFPDVQWHHLVLAARNLAAAFDQLHSAGIVVGDVNQGNLMVDQQMCVCFIDCDSFQVSAGGQVYYCPVGTPHFTPPELQSKKLRDVLRTPDHDCFGMAILIFHLLFVGRHPFAGRLRGGEELSIERAIAERRFAFSPDKAVTLVDPPPASLLLDDLPESVAEMFEQAFRGRGDGDVRPSPRQWVERLETLISRRKACSFDASHSYYDRLQECPWCRIEDEGGPAFFVLGGSSAAVSRDRLDALDRKISELTVPRFPDLAPRRLAMPKVLRPKRLASTSKMSSCDVAAIVMVAAAALCLLGIVSDWLLLAGTACSVVGGAWLLFGRAGRARRKQVYNLIERLAHVQQGLLKRSQAITARQEQRKDEYESAVAELRVERDHYRAAPSQLQDVLVYQRASQKNRFLARHLIRDNMTAIRGLNYSTVSILESFGVESALDVDRLKLFGVPAMGLGLMMDLMNWRQQVEATFAFKPDHGVTMNQVEIAGETTIRRFRVSQARRVLMGAKQLRTLADAGHYELERVLNDYDEFAAKGHEIALELRDFESSRRPLERLLNRSPETTLAAAIGIPLAGLLLRLIFG